MKSGSIFSITLMLTGTSTVSVPDLTFTTRLKVFLSVASKDLSSLIFPFLLIRK